MSKKIKKYTERPEILEGCQWFKMGDHLAVHNINIIVPVKELDEPCPLCKKASREHGFVENIMNEKEIVCPGDYIMRTGEGFYFSSKAVYFEGLYHEVK